MTNDEDDRISIVVGGVSYQDWFEVDLDSDVMIPADAWTVRAAIPSSDIRSGFREGEKCDIYVGRDRQMAGVIDEVSFNGERSADTMQISGRDKGAYLVDCEAHHLKAEKQTFETLIKKLLDPSFGIKGPIFSNTNNRNVLYGKKDKKKPKAVETGLFAPIPRARTKVDPGQKISSILDEHCKRLGVAWWMTADGSLYIGKPNYKQEFAYVFSVYEGGTDARANNVETWSVRRSISDRYSEIEVGGMGFSSAAGLFDGAKSAPKFKATAKDQDLQRRGIVRKTIIVDSDILSSGEAQKRADREMERGKLGALVITLTVPGFRQFDRLFTTDTIASVKIEAADIDGNFYVTQRRFTENRGKRRTQLTLHEKDVWLP